MIFHLNTFNTNISGYIKQFNFSASIIGHMEVISQIFNKGISESVSYKWQNETFESDTMTIYRS